MRIVTEGERWVRVPAVASVESGTLVLQKIALRHFFEPSQRVWSPPSPPQFLPANHQLPIAARQGAGIKSEQQASTCKRCRPFSVGRAARESSRAPAREGENGASQGPAGTILERRFFCHEGSIPEVKIDCSRGSGDLPGRVGAGVREVPGRGLEFFEKEVRPVLASHCYDCHGPQMQQGGLRLDSREGVLEGGSRGAAVVEGEPGSSWLVKAVRHQELEMPPAGRLSPEQIGALERWVAMGAPWPEPAAAPGGSEGVDEFYAAMLREHWSYQPLTEPRAPGNGALASGHPVDRFILAELERRGLQPAPTGDRQTLVRRLSLVLTGLPPEPEEVDRFVQDSSPNAYERLVDRLFASPHLGERWARHWMDVMRFGGNLRLRVELRAAGRLALPGLPDPGLQSGPALRPTGPGTRGRRHAGTTPHRPLDGTE